MSKAKESPSRLFDPTLMANPPMPVPPTRVTGDEGSRLSVSQLAALINATLRNGLPARLRVIGEISGLTDRTHLYFSLKDEGAVVSCVMFVNAGGRPRRLSFTPRDGLQVLATGRVEHYAKQGRTQFYVESLELVGVGALEQRFRALCDELRGLGWFDESRKRPLPPFPRRIAIVTSRTGAALQDVLDTLRRRRSSMEALIVDVRVQGEQAAPEIARAIDVVSRHAATLGIDALLLTRGGGSIEDLWAFNERIVAEAVMRAPMPVVAAIGHETDVSIAELVADLRAATPTQAAMRLSPDAAALAEQLDQLAGRLRTGFVRELASARERLRSAARHPVLFRPMALVDVRRLLADERSRRLRAAVHSRLADSRLTLERVSARLASRRPEAVYAARRGRASDLATRLRHAMRLRMSCFDVSAARERLERGQVVDLRARRERVEGLSRALTVAGPMSVLARGFSVTRRSDGAIVRSDREVHAGDPIQTHLADGSIWSVVSGAEHRGRNGRQTPGTERRRGASPKDRTGDEPGLFQALEEGPESVD